MIATVIAALGLAGGLGQGAKATFDPKVLDRIAAKIAEIGEKDSTDKQVASFLGLKSLDMRWHSRFDSERQVQLFDQGKGRLLVFLNPEKPFPEFGKTWLYSISTSGKLGKCGVQEPRAAFKALAPKAAQDGCLAEVGYWKKLLEIN